MLTPDTLAQPWSCVIPHAWFPISHCNDSDASMHDSNALTSAVSSCVRRLLMSLSLASRLNGMGFKGPVKHTR